MYQVFSVVRKCELRFNSLLLILTFFSNNLGEANVKTCGYSSCQNVKSGVINVHLVPHTHNDVGWLKTFDQYYVGDKEDVQKAAVRYILDTVVHALADNEARKFSYVEIAYFSRWWDEQNNNTKSLVHKLVLEGRLQFVLGGWSMNDEATTHYTAIIDQITLGLDFLNQTFGDCGRPLVAWQIDTFGHSVEQSNLFYLMGFDANIFMRLDYREKLKRIRDKTMEFFQNTNVLNSNMASKLFTNILYDTYTGPLVFCNTEMCLNSPIIDDPKNPDYNVLLVVNAFVDYITTISKVYTSEHILIPVGSDFDYQNAFQNFFILDKLIFYMNSLRKDINMIYSTPACYIFSVNKKNMTYRVKNFDFFPYSSEANTFWTGYYSSRSALKGFIRESNNLYHACKQVQVVSGLNDIELNRKVKIMGKIMGIMQHHDAITGTSKQQVAYDYAQRLYKGWSACANVISASISKLIADNEDELSFALCSLLNISYCLHTDDLQYKPFTIVLYNSLAVEQSHWTRIPVNVLRRDVYYVKDAKQQLVASQLIPITNRTRMIPERRKYSSANYELIFNVVVPPIGFTTFTIHRAVKPIFKTKFVAEKTSFKTIEDNNFTISNSHLRLFYRDNLLYSVLNLKSRLNINLIQSIRYYNSENAAGVSSGAYIFRPTTKKSISFDEPVSVNLIIGSLVTEVHQEFSTWSTLVTRLYKDCENVESEWTVGPIPESNFAISKEVVLHYKTNLKTNNTFYTDSNSRQLIPRIINERFDYEFNQTEPVAGNFYPVTSDVTLFDSFSSSSEALVIRPDRPLGAGAYESGMIETMIHRKTAADDAFGLNERLNEVGSDKNGLIVRGKQWFTIGYTTNIFKNRRIENVKRFNVPIVLFSKLSNNDKKILTRQFSLLKEELPKNLHITSLESHFNLENIIDYQIIRTENLYDLGSEPITFDLNKLFKTLTIVSVEELNLSANQFLKDVKRLKWNENTQDKYRFIDYNQGIWISILPSEIRTFKVLLKNMTQ